MLFSDSRAGVEWSVKAGLKRSNNAQNHFYSSPGYPFASKDNFEDVMLFFRWEKKRKRMRSEQNPCQARVFRASKSAHAEVQSAEICVTINCFRWPVIWITIAAYRHIDGEMLRELWLELQLGRYRPPQAGCVTIRALRCKMQNKMKRVSAEGASLPENERIERVSGSTKVK